MDESQSNTPLWNALRTVFQDALRRQDEIVSERVTLPRPGRDLVTGARRPLQGVVGHETSHRPQQAAASEADIIPSAVARARQLSVDLEPWSPGALVATEGRPLPAEIMAAALRAERSSPAPRAEQATADQPSPSASGRNRLFPQSNSPLSPYRTRVEADRWGTMSAGEASRTVGTQGTSRCPSVTSSGASSPVRGTAGTPSGSAPALHSPGHGVSAQRPPGVTGARPHSRSMDLRAVTVAGTGSTGPRLGAGPEDRSSSVSSGRASLLDVLTGSGQAMPGRLPSGDAHGPTATQGGWKAGSWQAMTNDGPVAPPQGASGRLAAAPASGMHLSHGGPRAARGVGLGAGEGVHVAITTDSSEDHGVMHSLSAFSSPLAGASAEVGGFGHGQAGSAASALPSSGAGATGVESPSGSVAYRLLGMQHSRSGVSSPVGTSASSPYFSPGSPGSVRSAPAHVYGMGQGHGQGGMTQWARPTGLNGSPSLGGVRFGPPVPGLGSMIGHPDTVPNTGRLSSGRGTPLSQGLPGSTIATGSTDRPSLPGLDGLLSAHSSPVMSPAIARVRSLSECEKLPPATLPPTVINALRRQRAQEELIVAALQQQAGTGQAHVHAISAAPALLPISIPGTSHGSTTGTPDVSIQGSLSSLHLVSVLGDTTPTSSAVTSPEPHVPSGGSTSVTARVTGTKPGSDTPADGASSQRSGADDSRAVTEASTLTLDVMSTPAPSIDARLASSMAGHGTSAEAPDAFGSGRSGRGVMQRAMTADAHTLRMLRAQKAADTAVDGRHGHGPELHPLLHLPGSVPANVSSFTQPKHPLGLGPNRLRPSRLHIKPQGSKGQHMHVIAAGPAFQPPAEVAAAVPASTGRTDNSAWYANRQPTRIRSASDVLSRPWQGPSKALPVQQHPSGLPGSGRCIAWPGSGPGLGSASVGSSADDSNADEFRAEAGAGNTVGNVNNNRPVVARMSRADSDCGGSVCSGPTGHSEGAASPVYRLRTQSMNDSLEPQTDPFADRATLLRRTPPVHKRHSLRLAVSRQGQASPSLSGQSPAAVLVATAGQASHADEQHAKPDGTRALSTGWPLRQKETPSMAARGGPAASALSDVLGPDSRTTSLGPGFGQAYSGAATTVTASSANSVDGSRSRAVSGSSASSAEGLSSSRGSLHLPDPRDLLLPLHQRAAVTRTHSLGGPHSPHSSPAGSPSTWGSLSDRTASALGTSGLFGSGTPPGLPPRHASPHASPRREILAGNSESSSSQHSSPASPGGSERSPGPLLQASASSADARARVTARPRSARLAAAQANGLAIRRGGPSPLRRSVAVTSLGSNSTTGSPSLGPMQPQAGLSAMPVVALPQGPALLQGAGMGAEQPAAHPLPSPDRVSTDAPDALDLERALLAGMGQMGLGLGLDHRRDTDGPGAFPLEHGNGLPTAVSSLSLVPVASCATLKTVSEGEGASDRSDRGDAPSGFNTETHASHAGRGGQLHVDGDDGDDFTNRSASSTPAFGHMAGPLLGDGSWPGSAVASGRASPAGIPHEIPRALAASGLAGPAAGHAALQAGLSLPAFQSLVQSGSLHALLQSGGPLGGAADVGRLPAECTADRVTKAFEAGRASQPVGFGPMLTFEGFLTAVRELSSEQ